MANIINHVQLNIVDDDGKEHVLLPETTADDVLVDMSTNTEVVAGNTVIPKDVSTAQELIDSMATLAFKSKVDASDFEEGVIVNSFDDIIEGTIPSSKLVSELQSSVDEIKDMNVVRFNPVDTLSINTGDVPGSEINDNIVSTGSTWSSKKISELVDNSDSILDDTTVGYSSTWSSQKIVDEVASRLGRSTATYSVVLEAGLWSTIANPAVCNLSIPEESSLEKKDIMVAIDDAITGTAYDDMYEIVAAAKISKIYPTGNWIKFIAFGAVPDENIRLKITVSERNIDKTTNNTDNVELNIPEVELKEVGARQWMYSTCKVPNTLYVSSTEISRTHYIEYKGVLHVFTPSKHLTYVNGQWTEITHDELASYLNGYTNSVFCVGDGKLYGCISGYYGQSLGTTTTYQSALLVMNDDYSFTIVKTLSTELTTYRSMAIYNGFIYLVSGTTENKLNDASSTAGGQYTVVKIDMTYPYAATTVAILSGLAELSIIAYDGHLLAMYSIGGSADSSAIADFSDVIDNSSSLSSISPYAELGDMVHGSLVVYHDELHILSAKQDLANHLIFNFQDGLKNGDELDYTNGAYAQGFVFENTLCYLPYRYLEVNDTCYPHVLQTMLFSYKYSIPSGYTIQLATPIAYRKCTTGHREQAKIVKISGNDSLTGVVLSTSTSSNIYTYNATEDCVVEIESSYVNPSVIVYK